MTTVSVEWIHHRKYLETNFMSVIYQGQILCKYFIENSQYSGLWISLKLFHNRSLSEANLMAESFGFQLTIGANKLALKGLVKYFSLSTTKRDHLRKEYILLLWPIIKPVYICVLWAGTNSFFIKWSNLKGLSYMFNIHSNKPLTYYKSCHLTLRVLNVSQNQL